LPTLSRDEYTYPYFLQELDFLKLLTTEIRELVQIFPPLFAHYHSRVLRSRALGRVPFSVGMLYHFTDIIGMHSVEDSKEVLAIGISILRVLILKVQHYLRVISEAGEDVLD